MLNDVTDRTSSPDGMLGCHTWSISHRLKMLSSRLVFDLGKYQDIDQTLRRAELRSRLTLRKSYTFKNTAQALTVSIGLSQRSLRGLLRRLRDHREAKRLYIDSECDGSSSCPTREEPGHKATRSIAMISISSVCGLLSCREVAFQVPHALSQDSA